MNEIYAIDPCAPQDLKDIKAMLNQFGLVNGRFIADLPDEWFSLLKQHVHHFKGLDQSRFHRLLELHKDALINIDLDFKRAKSWNENAIVAKDARVGISKILGTDPNSFGFETLQKFLWIDELSSDSRGAHIPMTIESYRKAIFPLLQLSTEVHLVDPFFHLRRSNGELHRAKEALLSDFLMAAENAKRCEVFTIHFKVQNELSVEYQEAKIEEDLIFISEKIKLKKISIRYTLDEKIGHGRYFFSIKGGLQFDHGFDLLRDKKNHVHWLSKSELEPIQNMYI